MTIEGESKNWTQNETGLSTQAKQFSTTFNLSHVSKAMINYFKDKKITSLDLQDSSPHIYTIETLWAFAKAKLRKLKLTTKLRRTIKIKLIEVLNLKKKKFCNTPKHLSILWKNVFKTFLKSGEVIFIIKAFPIHC